MLKSVEKDEKEQGRTEYDIPKVPIEIPSETPTVPNWYPMMLASAMDFLIRCPSPSKCRLHLSRRKGRRELEKGGNEGRRQVSSSESDEEGLTGFPRT